MKSASGVSGPPLTASERTLIESVLSLTAKLDVQETCAAVLDAVERIFAARSSWLMLHDRGSNELVTVDVRGLGADSFANVRLPADRGIVGIAFSRREPVFVPDVLLETRWFDADRVRRSGLRSVFAIPLVYEDQAIGVLGLDSPLLSNETPPSEADIARLRAMAAQAVIGIRNAQLFEAVEEDRLRLRRLLQARRQLRSEVGHLRNEMREAHSLNAIVGESHAFREVLSQVELVAPADSTVLLIGETGTGKELIARAIHDASRRCRNPFVAVNCAALPESLVESELFGYERGAFTGALSRKLGKFELADRGTLFLDEIGDLPAQAQAKLLRVIQEREVQRVGGAKPVTVNVRLIAATNQDLEARMVSGSFRADLFYRLSVFPIRLPPLCERRKDIPALVAHFSRRYADQQHKPVPRIAPGAMERLLAYDWPGNVRELQNVIERAVILARDAEIGSDLVTLPHAAQKPHTDTVARSYSQPVAPAVVPFVEAERRAILRALDLAGWRISGRRGAAEALGLKPTTLHAKMKKLGITRPFANP